jgi:hypothetical protein
VQHARTGALVMPSSKLQFWRCEQINLSMLLPEGKAVRMHTPNHCKYFRQSTTRRMSNYNAGPSTVSSSKCIIKCRIHKVSKRGKNGFDPIFFDFQKYSETFEHVHQQLVTKIPRCRQQYYCGEISYHMKIPVPRISSPLFLYTILNFIGALPTTSPTKKVPTKNTIKYLC